MKNEHEHELLLIKLIRCLLFDHEGLRNTLSQGPLHNIISNCILRQVLKNYYFRCGTEKSI
jgi:hypothetical protein